MRYPLNFSLSSAEKFIFILLWNSIWVLHYEQNAFNFTASQGKSLTITESDYACHYFFLIWHLWFFPLGRSVIFCSGEVIFHRTVFIVLLKYCAFISLPLLLILYCLFEYLKFFILFINFHYAVWLTQIACNAKLLIHCSRYYVELYEKAQLTLQIFFCHVMLSYDKVLKRKQVLSPMLHYLFDANIYNVKRIVPNVALSVRRKYL